jgi:membrane protein required for colicin V production
LTFLLGKLVKSTGLSGTDRLLGSVFGLVRGVALVLLLILVFGFTPIPSDPWWSDSRALQSMLPLAEWVSGFLPEQARELLDFHPEAEVLPT